MEFSPAHGDFESKLRALLPDSRFPAFTDHYKNEPRGRWQAADGLLTAPQSTDEVAQIITLAHEMRVGVVPFGGGTGLVGGQIMEHGPAPVVISLEKMNKIHEINTVENTATVDAGVILENLHDAAGAQGRLFPLSLASKGSAQIGGLLATNAGGINVLRYGVMRDLCLGVTAVLPDGRIWNGLKRLRKDNTGYDMRNLLIGSEGTLAIITQAVLKLAPLPAQSGTAFFAVASPSAALELLSRAKANAGDCISSFEIMHRQGFDFLRQTLPKVKLPFAQDPEWSVLVELGANHNSNPAELFEVIFAKSFDLGLCDDGIIATSQAQAKALWDIRENIPQANRQIGSVSSHDISLPLSCIPQFIALGKNAIAALGPFRINCFGHLGDGNLHYNIFPPHGKTRQDYEDSRGPIKTCIHDLVHEMGGSVSAEHGIGRLKTHDLQKYSDPVKFAMMRSVKQTLDPKCILNPGVLFDAQLQE